MRRESGNATFRGGLIVCAIAIMLSACFAEVPTVQLADWSLEIDGRAVGVVHLPSHLGHGLDKGDAVYRLRASLAVPDAWRAHDVTLSIPLLPAHVQLLVNHRLVPSLDEQTLDHLRTIAPHRFRIDSGRVGAEPLELELLVDNLSVQASWFDTPPRLSLGEWGDRWTRTVRMFNVGSLEVGLVSSLTLALVFAMRFLLGRLRSARGVPEDPKHMIFARLAFSTALVPATQLGLFEPLLGRRDLAVVMIAIVAAVTTSIELARRYLELGPRGRWIPLSVAAGSAALLVAAGSFLSAWVSLVAIAVTVSGIGYLMRLAYKHRTESRSEELRWIVGGWVIGVTISSLDLITVVGGGALLDGILLTPTAIWLFSAMLGMRLSRAHRLLLEQEVALRHQLERRVAEVEARNVEIVQLNDDLRRNVGDRSRELAAVLRRIGDNRTRDLIGTILANRYRVVRSLGAGAMGEVYEVERLSDGRALAAKVVRDPDGVHTLERFTREAELIARIDHPNVVRIFDVDVTSQGELFLVMELVKGKSLAAEHARFGDVAFARTVLQQIATALRAIHAGGIVHRDLKPANVLVETTRDGWVVKVADFGIAGIGQGTITRPFAKQSVDASDSTFEAVVADAATAPIRDPIATLLTETPKLTRTGAIMGTPMYMAPEAWRGESDVGAPADIFAFGLVAYELLGGEIEARPGGGSAETLKPIDTLSRGLPSALIAELQRCLHQDKAARPTATELVAAFERS
ncbi:hypothetical protein BH11MYX2_BH11MYX2_07950 [soil metagenome]